MKKEQWFISNPDESQLEVIKTGLSKNLVVVGSAGSGKTNLTLFKAKQADARGDSWGVIVASRAMRRMISYGLDAIGLNGERVTYSWAWTNRGGFDLRGDLYWEEGNPENIFLVNGNEVSRFRRLNQEYSINELVVGEYTIDFPDWVNEKYYKAFGRRTSNYTRINFEQDKFDLNAYTLLNTAVLTRNEDKPIDHIFVDEAQDLKIREYEDQYVPRARENIVFFGDDNQRITSGATMSLIAKCFKADMLHLNYNYRVPKSIARFAQSIMNTDLISSNMKDGGDSDYPKYPKPTLEWYPTLRDILD
ncbi:MAG: ATP-dependent helicase, partial [Porphyromonas sp.]|nr:ATP-dependent helicase [Porphyromonas sp.]